MRGGHFDAFCTFRSEESHKANIKNGSTFARCYASVNTTQEEMRKWCLEDHLWSSVMLTISPRQLPRDDVTTIGPVVFILRNPLKCTRNFEITCRNNRTPGVWGRQFISKDVRITRTEFVELVCLKLNLRNTVAMHARLVNSLTFAFYGALSLCRNGLEVKYVGVGATVYRRDFVRVHGPPENNTCLSAQILGFVEISGFEDDGTALPQYLSTSQNHSSVILTILRWLSPHPDATDRDEELRPVCPAPFDLNHALWTWCKLDRPRQQLTADMIATNLHCFPGNDDNAKRVNADNERRARFDLIQPVSLNTFLNCTVVNQDNKSILETVTIPF